MEKKSLIKQDQRPVRPLTEEGEIGEFIRLQLDRGVDEEEVWARAAEEYGADKVIKFKELEDSRK
jgi:hypothetical protein